MIPFCGKRGFEKKFGRSLDVGKQGFTLIEILVAVTIMGLAYVAILQSFSLSSRNIFIMQESRDALLANSLAFEKALLSLDETEQDLLGSSDDVVAVGNRFQLVLVSDTEDVFVTLKFEKK